VKRPEHSQELLRFAELTIVLLPLPELQLRAGLRAERDRPDLFRVRRDGRDVRARVLPLCQQRPVQMQQQVRRQMQLVPVSRQSQLSRPMQDAVRLLRADRFPAS
jgi:hypothetical protein